MANRLILAVFVLVFFPFTAARAQSSGDATALFSSTVYIVADAQIKGSPEHRTFYGSGVVVTPDGYVLTAAHVIPDLVDPDTYVNVRITGTVGTKFGYPIPLERTDFQNVGVDVAFLKFPSGLNLRPAKVTASPEMAVDSFITVVSFPLALDANILHGRITSLNGPKGTWITDSKVQEGSSGGPVFDAYGNLVGIVSGGFQNPGAADPLGLNVIIPVASAKNVAGGLNWQVGNGSQRVECKATPITITADQSSFPAAASMPFNRDMDSRDFSGVLATSYPWVILDHATVKLPQVATNFLRFCRLELKGGSRVVIGSKEAFFLVNYLSVSGGKITGLDSAEDGSAVDPTPPTTVGASGAPGRPGQSSGNFLIAVAQKMDGALVVELDGGHGGTGGTGGPGAPGATGAPGNGGSDSLFDCRRGPGDGERGSAGGAGGRGGNGGPGGNAGNLQIFRLQSTILPTSALSYGGRGGPGGAGGLGGPGGPGGSGGQRGSQTVYCHGGSDGPQGPQGSAGASGSPGADGLPGQLKDSVVTEQDIANFF
ncbi:trypsin-like peptidase domain-containing protein [Mesorhizobium sp.]|uniref:trypsin-like peptidase domain-containing protein n=1 Tax=Mesorhizobium sp. TaxID=1871066 RepID=UPI0025BD9BF5|nr:trypsin-like peptidase domain-containing protein [Mesorhizobium sp.]